MKLYGIIFMEAEKMLPLKEVKMQSLVGRIYLPVRHN